MTGTAKPKCEQQGEQQRLLPYQLRLCRGLIYHPVNKAVSLCRTNWSLCSQDNKSALDGADTSSDTNLRLTELEFYDIFDKLLSPKINMKGKRNVAIMSAILGVTRTTHLLQSSHRD